MQCPPRVVCRKMWVPHEECRVVRECQHRVQAGLHDRPGARVPAGALHVVPALHPDRVPHGARAARAVRDPHPLLLGAGGAVRARCPTRPAGWWPSSTSGARPGTAATRCPSSTSGRCRTRPAGWSPEQHVRLRHPRRCYTVPEVKDRQVPYTTCRMVPEQHVRHEIRRHCYTVPEQHVRQVPYTTCRMVPEQHVRYECRTQVRPGAAGVRAEGAVHDLPDGAARSGAAPSASAG